MAWTPSDYAGWYGAIVASILGGWEIWKESRSGPRLHVAVVPNMMLMGAGGQVGTKKFIMVLVTNRGDQSTVLTHHLGVCYRTRLDRIMRRRGQHFVVPMNIYSPSLPVRLEPGAQWQGMSEQE